MHPGREVLLEWEGGEGWRRGDVVEERRGEGGCHEEDVDPRWEVGQSGKCLFGKVWAWSRVS
jgi:hypothetical protein